MARTSNITFGQVASIADAMKAAGSRPTARSIRERIGSGSMGTIHGFLKQWEGKAPAGDEDSKGRELPSSIQNALMDFIGIEIATACEPLANELATEKEGAKALCEENERLESVIDRLQNERDTAQVMEKQCAALLGKCENDLSESRDEVTSLRKENANLQRELDLCKRQLEMLASYAPELSQAKADLVDCNAKKLEAEMRSAVLGAQLEAQTEKATDLIKRLEVAESKASSKDAEAKQANTHYQACAARLEEAARTIESMKVKASTPKTVTKKPAKLAATKTEQ